METPSGQIEVLGDNTGRLIRSAADGRRSLASFDHVDAETKQEAYIIALVLTFFFIGGAKGGAKGGDNVFFFLHDPPRVLLPLGVERKSIRTPLPRRGMNDNLAWMDGC